MGRLTRPTVTDEFRLNFKPLRILRHTVTPELSQEALAALVGTYPAAVGYWERGERFPTSFQLVRLARVLGVPPWKLYTVEDLEGHPIEFRRHGVTR